MWAGVTVESDKYIYRIKHLKKLPKTVNKFLLFEPLLGSISKLDLDGIGWVVVGGETNQKMQFRRIREQWVLDIRNQAKNAGIPFMFKHWSGKTANSKTALLEGKIWNEYPESILVA